MKKTRVLVTGGDGFIGSNFIIHLLSNPGSEFEVFNIDKQTYAGQGRNLEHAGFSSDPRHYSEKGDIARAELVDRIFCEFSPDYVFNFAAESHVDRSISVPEPFVSSNVLGTLNLLNAAKKSADRKHPIKKFIQISTDEVYGSIPVGSFSEGYILNPSSAYSASKASAEHFAQAYLKTHGVPVIITRSANNYGPYQFPEKLLPLFITNLIQGI